MITRRVFSSLVAVVLVRPIQMLSRLSYKEMSGKQLSRALSVTHLSDITHLFKFEFYSNLTGDLGEVPLKVGDRVKWLGKDCAPDHNGEPFFYGAVVNIEVSEFHSGIQHVELEGWYV